MGMAVENKVAVGNTRGPLTRNGPGIRAPKGARTTNITGIRARGRRPPLGGLSSCSDVSEGDTAPGQGILG